MLGEAFRTYHFDALSTALLYDILALRSNVFIIEQQAIYDDIDRLDQHALHICLFDSGMLCAYARLFAPGIKFEEASIGRIVLPIEYREKGLGRKLVEYGIDEMTKRFPGTAVRIEAQYDLRKFYQSLGFKVVSDIYDWGGIAHVKMLRLALPGAAT